MAELRGDCNQGWWPDAGPLQQAGIQVPVAEADRHRVDQTLVGGRWVELKKAHGVDEERGQGGNRRRPPGHHEHRLGWRPQSATSSTSGGYSYRPQTGELVHVWVHDPWEDTGGVYAGMEDMPIMWVAWDTLFGGYLGGPNGTWNRTFKTRRN